MKIAFVGGLSPSSILPEECIEERYWKPGHPAPWIGGLLPKLSKLGGFKLRYYVVHRGVKEYCLIEENGVEYCGIPTRMLERFNPHLLFYGKTLALKPKVQEFQPDLVHAFGLENGSATIASRLGVPTSCFIQGIVEKLYPYYEGRSMIQKQVALRTERHAVRNIPWMIAENEFAKNWALGHQPNAQITVIPHPVDGDYFFERKVSEVENFISVGGMDARKGMDTVIEAFSKMEKSQARLSLVGSGPSLGDLKRLAENLGVADRVDFHGFLNRDRVIDLLKASHVCLVASRMDTSPNVVTEAHAAGLPVIGTKVGGIPEMIRHGVDGYLVDMDDAAVMANHLSSLQKNAELTYEMGQKGQEKVRDMNDPDKGASAHAEYFLKIKSQLDQK